MSLKTLCISDFPLLYQNTASKDLRLGNYIEHWFRISTCAFKSVPTLKIILKEKKVACLFFFLTLLLLCFSATRRSSQIAIHYFFIWLFVYHLSFKLISLKIQY